MFAAVLRSYLIRLIPVCTAAFIRLQIALAETGTLQGSRAESRGPWRPVPELRGPFSTPDAHGFHACAALVQGIFLLVVILFLFLILNCTFQTKTTIILIWNSLTVEIRYLLCVPNNISAFFVWMLWLSCLIYLFCFVFILSLWLFIRSTNSLFIIIKCGLHCHALKPRILLLCP